VPQPNTQLSVNNNNNENYFFIAKKLNNGINFVGANFIFIYLFIGGIGQPGLLAVI
jgi:hypothetical protein